jgi:IclR helix-turn-helix domain
VSVLAHIGKVPVEEWLPFVLPVVALGLYGRHRERRRRATVERLAGAVPTLDARTVERTLDRWSHANRSGLSAAHVLLFGPPGPEGKTAPEVAKRTGQDVATVERLLGELEELGYLELAAAETGGQRRAWLTIDGYAVQYDAEAAILDERRGAEAGDSGQSRC